MRFTHFTIAQDGDLIRTATALKQAVATAVQRATETGKPAAVTAHAACGITRKAVINPDGTNEGIWRIDDGELLTPTVGQVYINRGGGKYLCLSAGTRPCPTYYNASGYASSTSGVFRNVKSGWTFTAKGIIQYADGTIEWDHSTDGRFEEVSPSAPS